MRYSVALSVVALAASLVAADWTVAADQSPAPQLEKRGCFLGICSGSTSTPNYQSDVNNCGAAGNKCPTGWANGSGSQCTSGVCYPGSCNSGYTLSTATRSCVNTMTDPNNCGSLGNVCSATNGVAGCSAGSCNVASCNAGYRLTTTYGLFGLLGSYTTCTAVNTASDVNNCGAVGKVCSFPNGGGSCSAGVCTTTSCNSGFYLVNGQCTTLSLATDVNNCGSVGNRCSATNGVAQCAAGSCSIASCNVGYSLTTSYSFFLGSSTTCTAVNVTSDVNNCGTVGNKCSFTNGAGTCSAGQCTYTSCNSGFYQVNGQCTALNLGTDVNNCGSVGKVCTAVNGVAQCTAGSCSIASCNVGYSLTTSYSFFLGSSTTCTAVNVASDVNNCGAVGNKCSFTNGAGTCSSGVCTYTSCNSGFYNVDGECTALNLQTDVNNCGSVGKACSYANGVAQCISGSCSLASCNSGYKLSTYYNLLGLLGTSTMCSAVNVASDVNNCGAVGNKCSFTNGAGTCSSGVCTYTSCNSGFYNVDGGCTALNLQTDVNNCGSVGKACSYANGVAQCISGSCSLASCNSGYKLSTYYNLLGLLGTSTMCSAVNVASDVNNCGAVGNKCSFTNGAGTCSSGVCTYTSCSSGFYNVDGECTALNLQTDVNNCGSVGKACSYANGVAQCISGSCSLASCNSGYKLSTYYNLLGLLGTSTMCSAVDTTSDVNNCGTVGKVCSFSNGAGTCSNGQCAYTSCNSGYYQVNGVCTSLNLQSDINNCGAVGKVCPTSLGSATCSTGSCKYTSCTSGYTLSAGQCTQVNTLTDVNNCGKLGNVCPSTYANGGSSTCVNGACSTTCKSGFAFDSTYNFCRDVSSDASNCGSIGTKCAVPGASAQICSAGACQATSCSSGLTLTNGACKTVDFSSDINNCGSLGNVCKFSPTGAAGTCTAGKCVITSCPTGYIVTNGACVLSASGKARVKKSKITKPETLCPTGEVACPIVGSTSFDGAVKQLMTTELSGMMASLGGYECIDTHQALDSCGGCASTGEGQDCTKIRGAAGVGCSAGTCVVFSCQAGYKPSLSGDRCLRTRSSHHGASNHTMAGGAKRHLAARQHGSAAFH